MFQLEKESASMEEKCCNVCDQVKPLTKFALSRYFPDGHRPTCQSCVVARRSTKTNLSRILGYSERESSPQARLAKHGIDQETYDAMLTKQDGLCAICGECEQLVIDHDHQLEQYGPIAVRGLLCSRCNTGLGMFKDDPKLLQAAIKYLQTFGVY